MGPSHTFLPGTMKPGEKAMMWLKRLPLVRPKLRAYEAPSLKPPMARWFLSTLYVPKALSRALSMLSTSLPYPSRMTSQVLVRDWGETRMAPACKPQMAFYSWLC